MIEKNPPASKNQIDTFLKSVNFSLSKGFLDFFSESNGAYVYSDDRYFSFWPLSDMHQFNINYKVSEYAPDFFLFGSDGGGMALAIEKKTGNIYEIPFIGMLKEDAIFLNKTFEEFLNRYL